MTPTRRPRMHSIRALAGLVIVLLITYFLVGAAATRCRGVGCDNVFIPLSLLLPLVTLVLVAATGLLAIREARGSRRAWLIVLIGCTTFGVAGPIVGAFVLRDSPRALVPLAVLLMASVPVSALSYTFFGYSRDRITSAAG